MQTHTCVWVMATGKPCGEKTKYRMVWDGGEPDSFKIRKYDAFCPAHQAQVDSYDDEMGGELD